MSLWPLKQATSLEVALTVSLWPLKQATSNAVMPLRGSLQRDVGIGLELPQKLNNEKYQMKLIKFGGKDCRLIVD